MLTNYTPVPTVGVSKVLEEIEENETKLTPVPTVGVSKVLQEIEENETKRVLFGISCQNFFWDFFSGITPALCFPQLKFCERFVGTWFTVQPIPINPL